MFHVNKNICYLFIYADVKLLIKTQAKFFLMSKQIQMQDSVKQIDNMVLWYSVFIVCRQHLQRFGSVWCMGLLRWIQPHLGRGVVSGCRAGEDYSGCHQGQEGHLQLHGRWHCLGAYCRTLHHHEPWIRRPNWTARESQGIVQVSSKSTILV